MENIRVKIVKNNGSLAYSLMNEDEFIRKTSLTEMVGGMTAILAQGQLYSSISRILAQNWITDERGSIQIYAAQDHSPLVDLYKNGNQFKELNIEELLN